MKKLLLHTILLFATCYLANQAIAAPWGFSHGMNTELLVTKLTGKAPNQTCVVDEKDAAFNEMLPDFDDPNKLRLLRLRDSGIDHLRLPIDMHFLYSPTLTANNDHLRADNVGKLLDYISAVNDKGLNVILDLHIARHVCGGNFGDTYSQFIEQKTKIVNGEEVYDPADLPALAGRHDAFVDFWRSLATQINLRIPYPNKVMLEPMNEPKFLNKQDDWLQFQDRLVKEIRQAAPQHRVIVTGSYWSNIDTLVGKLTSSGDSGPFNPVTPYIDPITGKLDDKIVYNFHFYEPMVLTHQGADWGDDEHPYQVVSNLPFPPTEANMAGPLSNPVYTALWPELLQYKNDFMSEGGMTYISRRMNQVMHWAKLNQLSSAQLISTEFGVYPEVAGHDNYMAYTKAVAKGYRLAGIGWTFYYGQSYKPDAWQTDAATDDYYYWIILRSDTLCSLGLTLRCSAKTRPF